jgi:hypothetical protein
MRIYVGFDDTDTEHADRGTGKLARWFASQIPDSCRMVGVLRQQLLVHESVPYTSHNSAACVVIDSPDGSFLGEIVERAVEHVEQFYLEGSDPGICAAIEDDPAMSDLMNFGRDCTCKVVRQKDAISAARQVHISGHGGTQDGIIGAAAAVGLTASGWSGRFIEFGDLRNLPDEVLVSDLNTVGIEVVSMERDANVPAPDDTVITNGWLRPRLLGYHPALFVTPLGENKWKNIYRKRERIKSYSKRIARSW